MDLETSLASDLLRAHPLAAAQAFERLPAAEVAALLEELEVEPGTEALQRMTNHAATSVVSELGEPTRSQVFEMLPTETAAMLLRALEASIRERVLAALPERRAGQLRSLLAFPEGTAGSLMDPEVLALPQDLNVEEAVERVRQAASEARYNVYVVDRDRALVGVLNLRELLMARPDASLTSLMKLAVHRIPARADRRALVSHPGWREVHALPVVDERGRYLGAIRYRTLRRVEEGLRGRASEEGTTARALGGLFRAGASAMLEAMVASTPGGSLPEPGRSSDGA
jgi:magnesium transporter